MFQGRGNVHSFFPQIPSLFRTNAAIIITDGMTARIGSLTADEERFMPWRTVDGKDVLPAGAPEADTLISGVFDKHRFLELIRDFAAQPTSQKANASVNASKTQ